MSDISIHGVGVVSPAGWGINPFRDALAKNINLPCKEIVRPGWTKGLSVRQTPVPQPRPAFLAHARLRRTSPISQYTVAAGLEAVAGDKEKIINGQLKLGIIVSVMSGSVNYSRRFYDETLRDPATASPLVFPETVFNAPASHIAALLGSTAINYTIVGDPGAFLQGIALAADWLLSGRVDGCLVIGAEEIDWLTADAYRLFQRKIILGDGGGAVYLKATSHSETGVKLKVVTDSHLFLRTQSRDCAAKKMRAELPDISGKTILCDGTQSLPRLDSAENEVWKDWSGDRVSPKNIFGEGLMAATAWQCVAAIDALQTNDFVGANVSLVGCNQQAIGAQFVKG